MKSRYISYMLSLGLLLACNDHKDDPSLDLVIVNNSSHKLDVVFSTVPNSEYSSEYAIDIGQEAIMYSGSIDSYDYLVNEQYDSAVLIFDDGKSLGFNKSSSSEQYINILFSSMYPDEIDTDDYIKAVYQITDFHYNDATLIE